MPLTSQEEIGRATKEKVATLINQQGLGVLSTKDADGHPYASLIAFACSPDNSELYFVTPRATRKYANLSNDGRVALLINDCVNDPADFHQAAAVTVLGRATSVADDARDDILKIYLQKHPYLDQFARSPSCALMAIHVSGFTMVQQFQNVSELRLDHDVDSGA